MLVCQSTSNKISKEDNPIAWAAMQDIKDKPWRFLAELEDRLPQGAKKQWQIDMCKILKIHLEKRFGQKYNLSLDEENVDGQKIVSNYELAGILWAILNNPKQDNNIKVLDFEEW